jgi:hypothetical protein
MLLVSALRLREEHHFGAYYNRPIWKSLIFAFSPIPGPGETADNAGSVRIPFCNTADSSGMTRLERSACSNNSTEVAMSWEL